MTDASYTVSGDALSRSKNMADGSGAHLAEQVSIEADRLNGTVKDGMKAVEAASKTYGSVFIDTYVRLLQGAMRNNSDIGNHILAMMNVKTPADALKLNLNFMQSQMISAQGRFYDLIGMKQPMVDKGD